MQVRRFLFNGGTTLYITPALLCDMAVQAAVLLALSSPVAFCLTIQRFSSPEWRFPMLFASMVFTLTVCGSYHAPGGQLWKFPLYLVMYASFSGIVAVLASELVTPTPAGKLSFACRLLGSRATAFPYQREQVQQGRPAPCPATVQACWRGGSWRQPCGAPGSSCTRRWTC